MKNSVHNLIIIGSGPAGLTAAIYAARANLKPIVIQGPKPGGQLMGTTALENWPGSSNITGPKLMIDMQQQAIDLGVSIICESVTHVTTQEHPFKIHMSNNQTLQTHTVIVATGATPNRLNCPGEEQFWGKGVSTCATCDGAFYHQKNIVVVGGGDSSMEAASFLHRNGNKVTIVHIGDKLTASYAMQQRVLNNPDFNIIYNSTVTEIHGSSQQITEVTITHQQTKNTQNLKTDAVFLAIGLKPNTNIFDESLNKTKWGHLIVTDLVKTSVPGIFAAGDVIDPKYRQAIVSAGFGCIASLEAEHYLMSKNLL